MRLTVRTLLAWIDEVLSPEEQRSLGAKVAASGIAPLLVERAKTVVEHAALATPAIEGRGLADDPNTAAEFLDNVLANDRLEAFERVCIESDMHLAEVAACHRLLAEIARDPQVVEAPGGRERRRLLETAAKHQPIGRGADEGVAVKRTARPASRASTDSVRRRRAPAAAWIAAAAAAALLVALSGLLAWSLVRGGRGQREIASGTPPERSLAEPPVSPVEKLQQPAPAPAAVAVIPPPSPPATEPAVEQPGEEPAAESVAPRPGDERRVPAGDALAIVAAPSDTVDPALATAPPVPIVASVTNQGSPPTAESAGIVSGGAFTVADGGPLLRRIEGDEATRWQAVAVGTPLAAREDLLAPPWCYPSFVADGVTIRLHPNTRAVLTRDASGLPRLEVVFGRAVVSGAAADAAVGVIAGGLCGVLSGALRQPAGIEVGFDREPGATARRRAAVHAGAAEKVWRQTTATGAAADEPLAGLAGESVVAARTAVTWSDRDPAGAVVGPPAAEPPWIRLTAAGDRTQRAAVHGLSDALAVAGAEGVEQPLRELATGRRAEDRMIAAATLALVGEYRDLVTLLCNDTPRGMLNEGQWTELESLAVPLAIARGENATAKLGEAFRTHGPAGKGDTLLSLARGFDDHELAAGGDTLLVDSLDDGSLAVRRYAIRRLVEIVQPDERHQTVYRADRSDGLRRDGMAWWRGQLEEGRIRRGLRPAESPPPAVSGAEQRDDE